MNTRKTLFIIALSVGFVGCFAQLNSKQNSTDHQSPYVDETSREIKALSEEQINGFLEGEGMGFAKPAELNGFPGPRHVLNLADELELSDGQSERVQSTFTTMNGAARDLGAQIVEAERMLNALFVDGTVTGDNMTSLLESIGELTSKVRLTHLEAHLAMMEILTDTQVTKYNTLRGYSNAEAHDGAHNDAQHHGHQM